MEWNLFGLIVCLLFQSVQAGLNFYLSQQESYRVLGLIGELAYIRDGSVNDVAQRSVIPVPSHIQELCFVWENSGQKSVKYVIAVRSGDAGSGYPSVSLNVSSQGVVPKRTQTFCLFLACTAQSALEVEVGMKINFTSQGNNTSLNVSLKKDCPSDNSKGSDVSSHVIPLEDPSYMMYIAVGVAFAVLLITLAAVAIFFCPKHSLCLPAPVRPSGDAGTASYTPVCAADEATTTLTVRPDAEKAAAESMHLQRSRIGFGSILLEGTFGTVYRGTMQIPSTESKCPDSTVDVTIKAAKENAAENQIKLMLHEGTRFRDLQHPNISSVIGIVEGDGWGPLLVYPSVSHGNLKRWLLQCKGSLDGSLPHPLCTQDLVTVALQALQGLQFLHQQNLVHRDVATRNCVIDEQFHVKVTDTALSRDLFPNDYHCLGDNENRPIKWMALESLSRREFSTASDIWSFGVFLWEVTTLAQQPYAEVDPFEVGRVLRDGYRLTQPINCPDELYAIMAYCWAASVRERPTAFQLYRELHKFHRQLYEYI